ncbi:MAG: DUF2461 family protein [Alistipes putredinis]
MQDHTGAVNAAPRGKKGGYSGSLFHVRSGGRDGRSRSQGHQLTTGLLLLRCRKCCAACRDEIWTMARKLKQPSVRRKDSFSTSRTNSESDLPKGYAPGSPYDEWLKLKDVYITERLAPEFMLDKELLKNTLHEFRKTKHFRIF